MKKIAKSIAGSLIIGILAGCSENSNVNLKQDITNHEVQASAPQPSSDQSTFKAGIFIDLNDIKDANFNEEIKNSLNILMGALVNKNEEEFRSAFATNQSADAHNFMLGKDYSFDKINSIEQDSAGRTIVSLEVKVKDGSDIREHNLSFYFVKDDQGEWGLRTID